MTTDDVTPPLPPIAPQQTAAQPAAPSRFWRFVKALVMPWPVSGRWAWRKVRKCPVWAIAVTTVIVAVAFIYRQPIWDFVSEAKDGKIIVNSPTVYTRQRLVNDRLDQARWLRTQLDLTELGKDEKFRIIDQVRSTSSGIEASVGGAPGDRPADNKFAPNPATDKRADNKAIDSTNIEATTTAFFRAKNAYREEVRSEITQTELDDRHDIDGNTIFRLTFDASIIAGTRKDAVAAIGIKLAHDPYVADRVKRSIYTADYQSVYDDWLRYFQRILRKSLLSVPQSLLSQEPDARMRLLFTKFILRRLCQFMNNDADLDHEVAPCEDQRKAAEYLLAGFTNERNNNLIPVRDASFKAALKALRTKNYVFKTDPESLPLLAKYACAQSKLDFIPLPQLFINDPTGKATAETIGCPFYDSLKERFAAGILLYERAMELAKTNGFQPGNVQDALDRLTASLKGCSSGCDVAPEHLKCYSADFIRSNLNAFQDDNRRPREKIETFLKLEIVGREINDCDLLVSPKIQTDLASEDQPKADDPRLTNGGADSNAQQGKNGRARLRGNRTIHEFIRSLNQNIDAYAYSVTPKNLTENISTAAETRDAFALLFRTGDGDKEIARALRKRAEQIQAVTAHPIVVGFGSGDGVRLAGEPDHNSADPRAKTQTRGVGPKFRRPRTSGVAALSFGWIVAPRAKERGNFEQIDGQYPLTAVISVPGWWRTVDVEITTCWLSRIELVSLQSDQSRFDLCEHQTDIEPTNLTVRLPTAIAEISRKLGFDVVQQPSLYDPRPKEITIGQRGLLLLEGARLWRSTEVTAAAQRADRISVLPNMEGILAEFKCVLPPPGLRQSRRNQSTNEDETITQDRVRVWTSEGVTEPIPVSFVWPPDWKNSLEKCLKSGQPTPGQYPQ